MTYTHHTKLDLVEGGNIFKQGDHPTLKFIGYDSLGNEVDLTGKQIEGALFSRNKGIIYEAPANFTDGRIVFKIDELLDNGKFQLEFTVTDSADPDYRAKFPSDEYAAQLTIKPSKDNMDFVGVSMTTVAQLKTELQGLQTEFAGQLLPRVDIVEDKQTQLEADYQAAAGALTEYSEVILARKGEPTLRAFNDKIVAQLAEKAKDSEVVKKGQGTLSDFDESTRATLQGLDPGDINAVLGSKNVKSRNLDYRAVKADRTDFIEVSTNLFDVENAVSGVLSTSTGEIISSTNYVTTKFYEVEPGEQISFFKFDRILTYAENGAYTGVKQVNTITNPETYTVPGNVFKVRLSVHNAYKYEAQINRGGNLLPYEPFYNDLRNVKVMGKDVKDLQIGIGDTEFVNESSNLFSLSKAIYNRVLGVSSGNYGNLIPSSTYITTDPKKTKDGENIVFKGFNRVVYYDVNDNYISNVQINSADKEAGLAIKTPANASIFRASSLYTDYKTAQINRGNVLLPFEENYVQLDGVKVKPLEYSSDKPFFFPPEEIAGTFKAKERSYDFLETVADVYSAYQTYETAHGEYITKEVLGKDSSGNYDVFLYKLKPLQATGGMLTKNHPKIIIHAVIHGEERASAQALFDMVRVLCEDWKENPLLEYLRWNVEFLIIPILNPWGYDNRNRLNSNNVNLQRNADFNWSAGENTGSSAFSEVETRYVRDLLNANKDAAYYLDIHSASLGEEYSSLMLHGLPDREFYDEGIEKAAKYNLEKTTREFIKSYNLPENEGVFGYYYLNNIAGATRSYASSIGIPASAIETFYKLPGEVEAHSSNTHKANLEFMTNFILTILKQTKDKIVKG